MKPAPIRNGQCLRAKLHDEISVRFIVLVDYAVGVGIVFAGQAYAVSRAGFDIGI